MPFDQAFALSSVLLAATAFSGLVLAQSVPLWLALPTALILIMSLLHAGGVLFLRRAIAQITISPTLWNVMLISAFVILLIDLTVISRDLLPAGIHFLVVLLGIKLLTLQQRRDYRHLYAISLMAILASAALTTDAWYVPIFLLYLLAAVWTLLLYHLTQETGEIPAAGTPPSTAACHATISKSYHSPLLLVDERNRCPDGCPDACHFLPHPPYRCGRIAKDKWGSTADDGVFRSS
jgi:Domain of unknown function (DUF3488).